MLKYSGIVVLAAVCMCCCFLACSSNPTGPEALLNEVDSAISEGALAKIGQDLTDDNVRTQNVPKRLRKALGDLQKTLKRIRNAVGENHQAKRALNAAYKAYRKSVTEYKEKDLRASIKSFKQSKRYAGLAIRAIRGEDIATTARSAS